MRELTNILLVILIICVLHMIQSLSEHHQLFKAFVNAVTTGSPAP